MGNDLVSVSLTDYLHRIAWVYLRMREFITIRRGLIILTCDLRMRESYQSAAGDFGDEYRILLQMVFSGEI